MLRRGVELQPLLSLLQFSRNNAFACSQRQGGGWENWYARGRLSSLVKGLYSLTDLPIGRLGRITLTYNIKISRRRVVVRRKQRGERAKKAPNPPKVELPTCYQSVGSVLCVMLSSPDPPCDIIVVTGCSSC
jgi:hypothetical protein